MTRRLASLAGIGLLTAVICLSLGAWLSRSEWASGASWSWDAGRHCRSSGLERSVAEGAASPADAGADSGAPSSVRLAFEAGDSLDIDLTASVNYQPGPKAEAVVSGEPSVIRHVRIADGRIGFDDEIDCHPYARLAIRLTAPAITAWGINGSSDLDLAGVDQQELRLRIRGSGTVAASGAVRVVALNVAGSGEARLASLSAKSAEIVVHGSGEVEVTAQDAVDIAVAGSGRVKLHGHPARISSHVSGSGRIEQTP